MPNQSKQPEGADLTGAEKNRLDRILVGHGPGPSERDSLFAAIESGVTAAEATEGATQAPWWRRWWTIAMPLAAAGAAVLVIALPSTPADDGEFTPRGTAKPTVALGDDAVQASARCENATGERPLSCTPGDTISLELVAKNERVAGVALLSNSGRLTWFYPSSSEGPVAVGRGGANRALKIPADAPLEAHSLYVVHNDDNLTRESARTQIEAMLEADEKKTARPTGVLVFAVDLVALKRETPKETR